MHAIQAYDAVEVIARARANGDGNIIQGISSINFIGLSGKVQFRSNTNSMSFNLINMVGKSYREMGRRWNKGKEFYESKIDKLGMVWPGGITEKVPGGWGKLRKGVPASTSVEEFVKVEKDERGRVKVTGFCIDVFVEAIQRLNYTLEYEFHPYNGISYDDPVAAIPELLMALSKVSYKHNRTSILAQFK